MFFGVSGRSEDRPSLHTHLMNKLLCGQRGNGQSTRGTDGDGSHVCLARDGQQEVGRIAASGSGPFDRDLALDVVQGVGSGHEGLLYAAFVLDVHACGDRHGGAVNGHRRDVGGTREAVDVQHAAVIGFCGVESVAFEGEVGIHGSGGNIHNRLVHGLKLRGEKLVI